jgi:uncharacterized protein (DUF2267 family)
LTAGNGAARLAGVRAALTATLGVARVFEPLRAPSIDHAVGSAQSWLNAIHRQLACGDPRVAFVALRSVLHLIRDRLPLPETVALGAQLPLLIRGLYYEGWRPHAAQPGVRHMEEFLGLLERSLHDAGVKLPPQRVADVVFDQLCARIAPCDLERVVPALPSGMRLLFTAIACRPGFPQNARHPAAHPGLR